MSKPIITYEIVSLPSKEKLSPQLKALISSIEFLSEEADGKTIIDRDKLYKSWLADINMEANEKVFASYIHQLITFAFIDRMNIKPKKALSVDELKKMIAKQMALLAKAEATG